MERIINGFTATVEQAGDGSWTSSVVAGKHTVLGEGDTKEEAIEDVRRGTAGLIDYLKAKGEPVPFK